MTSITTADRTDLDRIKVRHAVPFVGVGTAAITTALTIWGAHDWREITVVLVVLALTVVGVYGFLLPRLLRRDSAPNAALILAGIAAALFLPAFWSGQSLVLGMAAVLLGYAGKDAAHGARRCLLAMIIGLLSALAYLALYGYDAISAAG